MIDNWKIIKLGDFKYIKGYPFKSKDYKKNGNRVIRVSDISDNYIKNDNPIFVSDEIKAKCNNWEVQTGDIVVTTVGSKPPMWDSIVGKPLLIRNEYEGNLLNQNNVMFKIGDINLAKIIFENLKTDKYVSFISEIYRGNANQASITVEELTNYNILIPEYKSEQKEIADVLTNIDNLIENLKKLIDKKEKIMLAIMEKKFEEYKKNNTGIIVKLGDCTSMYSGGTPNTANKKYYNGNINWLSITDISNSEKYIKETKVKITELGLKNSAAKVFPKDTLFFAMYASVGKVIISQTDMASSQAILGMRCEKIDREFLYYYLLNNKKELLEKGQTGTQTNLSKNIMENYEICIPEDKNIQKSIGEQLAFMDKEISMLKKKLEKYQKIKSGIVDDLLTGKVRLKYE